MKLVNIPWSNVPKGKEWFVPDRILTQKSDVDVIFQRVKVIGVQVEGEPSTWGLFATYSDQAGLGDSFGDFCLWCFQGPDIKILGGGREKQTAPGPAQPPIGTHTAEHVSAAHLFNPCCLQTHQSLPSTHPLENCLSPGTLPLPSMTVS